MLSKMQIANVTHPFHLLSLCLAASSVFWRYTESGVHSQKTGVLLLCNSLYLPPAWRRYWSDWIILSPGDRFPDTNWSVTPVLIINLLRFFLVPAWIAIILCVCGAGVRAKSTRSIGNKAQTNGILHSKENSHMEGQPKEREKIFGNDAPDKEWTSRI